MRILVPLQPRWAAGEVQGGDTLPRPPGFPCSPPAKGNQFTAEGQREAVAAVGGHQGVVGGVEGVTEAGGAWAAGGGGGGGLGRSRARGGRHSSRLPRAVLGGEQPLSTFLNLP